MKPEDNLINYTNSTETRIALLEMSIMSINQTLIRLENKMDKQFDELRRTMKTDFKWILTIIAGLGAIMAHGFHWF